MDDSRSSSLRTTFRAGRGCRLILAGSLKNYCASNRQYGCSSLPCLPYYGLSTCAVEASCVTGTGCQSRRSIWGWPWSGYCRLAYRRTFSYLSLQALDSSTTWRERYLSLAASYYSTRSSCAMVRTSRSWTASSTWSAPQHPCRTWTPWARAHWAAFALGSGQVSFGCARFWGAPPREPP